MSEQIPNTEANPAQEKPWQFSLRTLLLLMLGSGLWMGVAIWSLKASLLIIIWVLYFCLLYPFRDKSKKQFTIFEWIPIVATILFFFFLLVFPDHGNRIQQPGTVEVLIRDAMSKQPIQNAQVQLIPNGIYSYAVSGSTNARGLCQLTGNFQAIQQSGGLGRKHYSLFLAGTLLNIQASGYERLIVPWEDLAGNVIPSSGSSPDPIIELELTPET